MCWSQAEAKESEVASARFYTSESQSDHFNEFVLIPMSLRPLIAICGTTGVGKSKLAIEIAQYLSQNSHSTHGYNGARIINADAMQVYAGMDIITNKVPLDEQAGIEHLLMGYKKPGEQYVVGQWVTDAIQAVRSQPFSRPIHQLNAHHTK